MVLAVTVLCACILTTDQDRTAGYWAKNSLQDSARIENIKMNRKELNRIE